MLSDITLQAVRTEWIVRILSLTLRDSIKLKVSFNLFSCAMILLAVTSCMWTEALWLTLEISHRIA